MHDFRVWAPVPERVELVLDDRRVPMDRGDGGWWRWSGRASEDSRYGFSLDGGPVRPDPRSPSQPDGVDGLSAVVDHTRFSWSDAGWRGVSLRGAVLYELHVGTFTAEGTFDAATARLGHLVELGIDAVELLPVAEFPGARGWGYDGVDLFAPHRAYGGPGGLKRLIDACHEHAIGVVIDVVYNHLGPAGNHLSEFGPYFSERHHTNWGAVVNLDGPGSDEVRRLLLDNALMWLRDYHADGLRLDAVHALVDESARHLLEELAEEVDALASHVGRPLFLIAESDLNDPRFVRSRDAGGYGLDAAWADEWHHALHAALDRRASRATTRTSAPSRRSRRRCGRPGSTTERGPGIGSGTTDDRPTASTATDSWSARRTTTRSAIAPRASGAARSMSSGRLRVAAALLLTGPFTPMLFQGEEWGASTPFQYFTDHDRELGRKISDGRRQEFAHFEWDPEDIPDPQSMSTFAASKLDWGEAQAGPHADLLRWYRTLIRLRREHAELSDPRPGTTDVDVDDDRGTVTIHRGSIAVYVNIGAEEVDFATAGAVEVLATSEATVRHDQEAVVLPPDTVAIVRHLHAARLEARGWQLEGAPADA